MSLDEKIINILKSNHVTAVITVPCKFFAGLLDKIKAGSGIKIIWPTREEEGLGISAGMYLGGARSLLLIQNSGLGNMVNAIKSLNQYYNIPFFAIVSHRGGMFEKIDAQKPMGEVTPRLLGLLGIKYEILQSPMHINRLEELFKEAFTRNESRVVLLSQSFWRDEK